LLDRLVVFANLDRGVVDRHVVVVLLNAQHTDAPSDLEQRECLGAPTEQLLELGLTEH
jgi:hypothetical protein